MENPVNPSSPFLQEKSSFVIADQSKDHRRRKKILLLMLILLICFSFFSIFKVLENSESVADIRNFAREDTTIPAGFGGLVQSTPQASVQVATPKSIFQTIASFFQPRPTTPSQISTITPGFAPNTIVVTPTPTNAQIITSPSMSLTQASFQTISTPASTPTPPAGGSPMPIQTTTQPQQPSTPTPLPLASCQRVELFKGGEDVTQNMAAIGYGDTIRFVGYANNVGAPVRSLTFRLMIDNQEVERVEAAATLVDNAWIAQYDHAFTAYGAHRVTVVAVTPL